MKTTHPNKILTGIAGEYFVAAELSRRGYVASLTLRNTRGIDILASNTDATKSVGIQEKGKGSGVNGTKLSRIPFIDCHLWSSVATATQPAKDAALDIQAAKDLYSASWPTQTAHARRS